jgi:hypothetical protein
VKRILNNLSNRFGYDGWLITVDGHPMAWSFSTTREECRELLHNLTTGWAGGDLFRTRYRIVKATVKVEVI